MVTNIKKLIIFSYDFPPSNGGIARLCQEISVGQQYYFDEVTVLTRKKTGENIPYNLDKVTIVELPNKRLKCEWAAFKYLQSIKNKGEINVLCGLWHPEASLVFFAGFKNVCILGHGTEFLPGKSMFRKNFWLPFYAKKVLNKAKLVIANSNYTKQLIEKINPKVNVVALPLGVNEDFFIQKSIKSTHDKLKIATLSRVLQFKGYDFIAKTIANLPIEYRKKIEWNIGGIGPYLKDLKILVLHLGIQDQVHFHGFIPDSTLPDFYNSNDIFVLCTREQNNSAEVEGFGLVFLEAQSCGIPVIGVCSGGIPDAIEKGNGGWLINQDDEKMLSELIISFIKDKDIIRVQGNKARQRILKNCTWEIYNKEIYKLLTS
jgi:phosphatidylinositol alpha-1,6-mannosyltransferase